MRNLPKGLSRKAASYALIVFICILIVFPIYWMIITSLKTQSDLFLYPPSFLLKTVDFSPYTEAFRERKIFLWIKNSLMVALSTVGLNLFIATLAAYAIAKLLSSRGKNIMLLLVLSTQLVPPPLIVTPLYIVFSKINLIDTYAALIISDSVIMLPFSTWILTGFFEKLPKELGEAASLDGCTKWGIFYHIALPIALPILFTVSIITFYDAWNEYLFAVTFITSQSKWVGVVGLSSFIGQFLMFWRVILAHAVVYTSVLLIIYLLCRRYIIRGIAEGFTSK